MDIPISDTYEIGCSPKIVSGVVYGMKYLILAMKKEMLEKMFLGYICSHFVALMEQPMVRDGRYTSPT